jgi:WD40 repeat protein
MHDARTSQRMLCARARLARLALCVLLPACVQEAELPVLAPGGPARGEVPALAFVGSRFSEEQALYVLPRDPGEPPRRIVQQVKEANRGAPPLAVSPDGRFIAYGGSQASGPGRIVLVEVGTQTKRILNIGEVPASSELAWSPDGTRLAFVSTPTNIPQEYDEEIYVVGTAEGSVPIRLTDNKDDDIRPAWSPDGSKVRFLRVQGNSSTGPVVPLEVLADGSGGAEVIDGAPSLGAGSNSLVTAMALSSDGLRLAYVSRNNTEGTRLCIRGPQGEHCPWRSSRPR